MPNTLGGIYILLQSCTYLNVRESDCPEPLNRSKDPEDPPPPVDAGLNKINSVEYPPPSARCGNRSSPELEGAPSIAGGVVVMRKSLRSLYRLRRPTTEIPEEAVETRRIPLNELGRPGNNCARNCEVWPKPANVPEMGAGNPFVDPSRLVSSNVTDVGIGELFAIAMPL